MSIRGELQSWHDFYLVAGQAAASLVGLLFVGLTLHLRAVLARPEVRGLARVTFSNFALVLIVALFFIIPEDSSSLGEQLLIAAAVSLAIAAPAVASAVRSETRTLEVRQLAMRFGFSILGYIGVGVSGALIIAANSSGVDWLAAAVIAMLVISLRNSWDLLVSVGASVMTPAQGGTSDSADDSA